jgi:hypothetical protein
MAAERCVNGNCYLANFYHSTDLNMWNVINGHFKGVTEAACPTIRYSNGYYYVFYLAEEPGYFATLISRSFDLNTWEDSKQAVLSPDGSEGDNASDLDLVELPDGTVRILYVVGYQTHVTNDFIEIKEASYQGSLDQLLETFFN